MCEIRTNVNITMVFFTEIMTVDKFTGLFCFYFTFTYMCKILTFSYLTICKYIFKGMLISIIILDTHITVNPYPKVSTQFSVTVLILNRSF